VADRGLLTKVLPSIRRMRQLAYKKIFEGLNYFEEKELEYGIQVYPTMQNLSKDKRRALKSIIGILIVNEDGGFYEMKEKVREHKLDYKQIYGVF